MNIAIVDDEPVFLKRLHNKLRDMKGAVQYESIYTCTDMADTFNQAV